MKRGSLKSKVKSVYYIYVSDREVPVSKILVTGGCRSNKYYVQFSNFIDRFCLAGMEEAPLMIKTADIHSGKERNSLTNSSNTNYTAANTK